MLEDFKKEEEDFKREQGLLNLFTTVECSLFPCKSLRGGGGSCAVSRFTICQGTARSAELAVSSFSRPALKFARWAATQGRARSTCISKSDSAPEHRVR